MRGRTGMFSVEKRWFEKWVDRAYNNWFSQGNLVLIERALDWDIDGRIKAGSFKSDLDKKYFKAIVFANDVL